ncbi:MAG: MBL fold metallo-hydrolase [Abditibacteriales bacterium]|nr:MBL fold metallo-hydrolase [Abditibacteriales bacterium]MDW8367025.1 MBL fold metallo-hydrolase [Abditibacteriales bacterium]
MQILFLGTGTSVGVPVIGCTCATCTSPDPKNKRFRPSILVSHNGKNVLVDTPPDLRSQALTFGVTRVDAVLLTHTHADHLNGLDDLRQFTNLQGEYIPLYGREEHLRRVQTTFDYAFVPGRDYPGFPRLRGESLNGRLELFGLTITPLEVHHGGMRVSAFRFEDEAGHRVAYVTDTNHIPEATMKELTDLDVLILDALRYRPHPVHFSLAQAIAVARQLQPRQTYFTHVAHDLEHHTVNAALPPEMALAYDGLVISF